MKTKKEVSNWLDLYKIKNYVIQDDLSIDVNGDVNLVRQKESIVYTPDSPYDSKNSKNPFGKKMEVPEHENNQLPVQFNVVYGNFDCSDNGLISLKGAPSHVGKMFNCSNNKLTSLVHAPNFVGTDYICSKNSLTSLKGSPMHVKGNFNCSANPLVSLLGSPNVVDNRLHCSFCKLISLQYGPERVKHYYATFNPIETLDNFNTVFESISFSHHKLTLAGLESFVTQENLNDITRLTWQEFKKLLLNEKLLFELDDNKESKKVKL